MMPKQVGGNEPPPRASVSRGWGFRTLDSLPAPVYGGGRSPSLVVITRYDDFSRALRAG